LETPQDLRNNIVVKIQPGRRGGTREQIVAHILAKGPQTAANLATELSITPAGIRRHLDSLVQEGILLAKNPFQIAGEEHGRGRPSKVFAISERGRERFQQSYDDLASAALEFMGRDLMKGFARKRITELLPLDIMKSRSNVSSKIEALSKVLSEQGYSAIVHRRQNSRSRGVELCQNHCPIAHVASEYPEFCEAETERFSELLGTHVQRLATIAHGDGVCTTFIPQQEVLPAKQKPHRQKKAKA
jgi:predicted ArsR family transcriptional regulator